MRDLQVDWAFISYALRDAAEGIGGRWDATAAGDGKRAARHAKLLERLGRDLLAVADVVGDPGFVEAGKRADAALADTLAGPLAALGEDLRVAFHDPLRPVRDRRPARDLDPVEDYED